MRHCAIRKLLKLLLTVTLLLCATIGVVQAASSRVIKVAFFPMDGYHIRRADGSYSGMDVEYLTAVCEYADWNIEYVECKSWEEALSSLYEKKVDLVGSAQYSAERAEKYLYASLSSGYTFGVIATNPNSTIAYEDFHDMRDITFGMVSGYVRKNEFLQYLSSNGIESPTIKEYESTTVMQKALDDGEIDAFVHTFTEVREGQRLIGRFAPRPFYYISYKGNDAVMRTLDQAIADLNMNHPELEVELMNKFYYNRFDKLALLTTEEKAYLKSTESITVGYLDGHYPFSYEVERDTANSDIKERQFIGLAHDILEAGFSVTGLKINYLRLPDEQSARAALNDGKIDLLIYYTGANEDNSMILREYAKVPLVLVMKESAKIKDIKTMAVVEPLKKQAGIEIGIQDVSLHVTDTQEQSLEKIVDETVDAAICDGYLAEHLFRTQQKYEDLQIKLVLTDNLPIYAAVRKDNRILTRIIAKTIASVDPRMVTEYMLRENVYPRFSLQNFIRDHSVPIVALLSTIMLVIIGVAIYIILDERKIQRLMYKDTSLNIWNLNYLFYKGKKYISKHNRNYATVALTLSQFIRFNSIYGLNTCEQILRGIADDLTSQLSPDLEICSRDHGYHFLMLLCVQNQNELLNRLRDIKRQIEKNIYARIENRTRVKVGIYFLPNNSVDLPVAMSYAEQALELVENQENGNFMIYDEDFERNVKERHEREKILDNANPKKDFLTYYQPKVDISTGKIVGAEALVRFSDPTDGKVKAPGFFVPYYEQTGKIMDIDFFVYESACAMLCRRLGKGENVVPISCNFSRMHFVTANFVERFETILKEYQVPRDLIEVEITETLVLEELQRKKVLQTLQSLDNKSIPLSIDDFGSGYSSLGVFESIPASVLKLDRSFLINKADRERQIAIMQGIVKLANKLKVRVVCEGVETEEDVEIMREIGAHIAQGYYYSKPIPEAEFELKLSQQAEVA